MSDLSLEEIESLLDDPIVGQDGPVRYFDREMRCTSRGCGSSTYIKVGNIAYCSTHVIQKLNEMLIEKG